MLTVLGVPVCFLENNVYKKVLGRKTMKKNEIPYSAVTVTKEKRNTWLYNDPRQISNKGHSFFSVQFYNFVINGLCKCVLLRLESREGQATK